MRGWLLRILIGLALLTAVVLAVIWFPQPLFAYHLRHGAYDLWSDRPIPPQARGVLDEVTRRLSRSPLWSPDQRFAAFICNDNWRLALYSQRFSGKMAGATDTIFTRKVYLRGADIAGNRLIPPHAGADMSDRPLTYYLAHEFTHSMESRAFGRAPALRYPHWLLEGYADYVGKAGQFDYAANLAALKAGSPQMDWKKSGLYRVYHLETAYYLDHRHMGVRDLFAARPSEAEALGAVKSEP
ncbi:MAG TPA: hypothetical protein VGH86_10075 [Phenylobacterium sp.]